MNVKTKTVTGRRELHFNSVAEIANEANRLAAAEKVVTLGNWSLGQILQHLATAMLFVVEGKSNFKAPFFIRFLVGLRKKKILNTALPASFTLPLKAAKELVPPETSTAQGLAALMSAIEKMNQADTLYPHPVFGKLTKHENELLQLRHAELHLSFVIPE